MKQLVVCLMIFFFGVEVHSNSNKTAKELIKEIKRDPERVSFYDLKVFAAEQTVGICSEIIKLINNKKVPTVLKLGLYQVLLAYKDKECVNKISDVLVKTTKCDPLLVKLATEMKVNSNIYSHSLTSKNQNSIYWALRGIICTKQYCSRDCVKVYNLIGKKYPMKIRILAVEAVAGYPTERSIKVLLNSFQEEELKVKIHETLMRLTDLPATTTKREWYSLLSHNKRKELPKILKYRPIPNIALSAEQLKEKEQDDKVFEEETQGNFYGLDIQGDNIIFILDRSGSMTDLMETLKQNLYHVLENIKKDSKVSFVFFGEPLVEAYPKRGLALATKSKLKKIKSFVQEVNAAGGTPMGRAIEYCYEEIVATNHIDTIYLLSDGEPQERILIKPLLEYYNGVLEIPIYTVSLGRDSTLLKEIAENSSGKYIRVD